MNNPAINALRIAKNVCETNESIHIAEGDDEQAAFEAANAQAYREAIEILKAT